MTDEADQTKKQEEAKKEEKPGSSAFTKKLIRIVTVIAYCSGISGAGVLLSLYYIFFWDPQITGVRPPGYLRSGGMPEARMAPLPEAFSGNQPIAHPHKMSKEFMEAYLANLTKDEVGPQNDLMAAQPTPKVMSVVRVGGSEGTGGGAVESHYTPTQPQSQRGEETSHHQGHSSTSPQQHQQERHQQQQQQQHHQQRHHQQGEALPTSA